MEQRYDLSGSLLHWYDYNKRILPWRENKDPYRIWISEIMLQQTRVEAVKPYFDRFMEVLPTVYDLAKVDDDRLMKLWEGLGYYNRARNLKAAAQTIVEEYGGQLPADYDKLLSLKGIGMYTAGAIGSIAFELQVPAVDGNVLRVLTRLWGDDSDILKDKTKKAMGRRVMEFMPEDRPGDFNQALMELGAVVCVPNGSAHCEACPVSEYCFAYRHGTVEELPVKAPKKERILQNRTVLVIQDGEKTAIQKRPEKGLLAGLYELPNLLGHLTREEVLDKVKNMQLEPLYIEKLPDAKHIFSHIEWRMTGYLIRVASLDTDRELPFIFAEKKQSEKQYAIPSAFRAYVKYMKEESGK